MTTNQKIRALVDDFVEKLSAEIRSSAVESVQAALKGLGGGGASAGVHRGPSASASPAGAKPRRKRRNKRMTGSVSTESLLAAIRAHNGERTEVIANDLGVSSKVFKPQLDELIAAGTVKRKGKARGSTLHV